MSKSNVSKVELIDNYIYKTQPKFLTDNEIWCLHRLYPYGYVPWAEQVSLEVIKLEYIQKTPVTDIDKVAMHFKEILAALKEVGIKHGDATEANVLIRNNYPYLIDFSESRLVCDPRPSKRPEGDKHWLDITLERLKEYAT